MPSGSVYLVLPALMAAMAASLMLSGVSKSGSPADRAMMSRPAAFRARASALIAMVAAGAMRRRAADSSDMVQGSPGRTWTRKSGFRIAAVFTPALAAVQRDKGPDAPSSRPLFREGRSGLLAHVVDERRHVLSQIGQGLLVDHLAVLDLGVGLADQHLAERPVFGRDLAQRLTQGVLGADRASDARRGAK